MKKKDFDFVLSNTAPQRERYKVIALEANPVPLELAWHELTEWKHILEVKAYNPQTFQRWIENNKIPYFVLKELDINS